MSRASWDVCTRMDELWAQAELEERRYQETLADDPGLGERLDQFERQRAARSADRAQAEIDCGRNPF